MTRRSIALAMGAAAAGVLLFVVGLRALPDRNASLPVLGVLPEFSLLSSRGASIGRDDLLGRPWVADLIFTSCAGTCPRMTTEMARLEERTRNLPDARFVSITVDPERDTPEVLAAYAKKLGVDRERWLFLTGDRDEIFELAASGLLLPAEDGDPEAGQDAVLHSSRFVLIDSRGRIRGFYDSRDTEALSQLRTDLQRVADAPT